MSGQAVILLVALLTAHFLGDFTPLASPTMQDAKARGAPLAPIGAHAAIHAVLVGLAVAVVVRPIALVIIAASAAEFATHFGLDWIKGRLAGHRAEISDARRQVYWTLLGVDQLGHALVLVAIAAMVL